MFGFSDLIGVVISAFIILPVVVFLREVGYLIVTVIFGVKNPRITIGSGPRRFKIGIVDVRKYYHLYSWFSYDSIKRDNKFVYVCIYAGPILINLILAFIINALLVNGILSAYQTFWERFIFYTIYYVLLDAIPMITINEMPNNGMIIYEMIRYGKRIDHNKEPFLPATSEIEEQYQQQLEKIKEKHKK
ncbi:hypothetical protein [Lederbergia galactosidilytica]|uniref:Uncharacterized protein n=1 Tax=Lederbergia galactosidilytica TaxID=217031 RepID=A0A177ZJK9_9BACI|nr:hypothetical protein [Lederbergia galactosidilytica]KRG16567.1 hypothetical protein ACA30_01965 [Virgibacillus soli]MBP1914189.1 hypothetical protein [Lederbergia galactosidilytica]OAK67649.1 hypothetical protein ABB05_19590 [Lederbergia galactosidilytica]